MFLGDLGYVDVLYHIGEHATELSGLKFLSSGMWFIGCVMLMYYMMCSVELKVILLKVYPWLQKLQKPSQNA